MKIEIGEVFEDPAILAPSVRPDGNQFPQILFLKPAHLPLIFKCRKDLALASRTKCSTII